MHGEPTIRIRKSEAGRTRGSWISISKAGSVSAGLPTPHWEQDRQEVSVYDISQSFRQPRWSVGDKKSFNCTLSRRQLRKDGICDGGQTYNSLMALCNANMGGATGHV